MSTTLCVQFSDSTEATIISYFGCPQNASAFPNLGTVLTTDPRWATYYDGLPTSVQAALPAPTTN